MITRLLSVGCGFGGGFFTLATMLDGPNGWVPSHTGIALTLTVSSVVLAAFKD